jgi:outer membrane protein OmpU
MDNLKKIGLTALGTALVSSASVAGEVGVTGTAQITFVGQEHNDNGNGWSMTDSLSFSGSADLDNGWTVTYSQAIDGGAANGNTDIVVNMGDMGTYTFVQVGVDGPVQMWDDKTPSANEETWANVAGSTAAGRGVSTNNAHKYSNSSLMDGLNIELMYQPSATATHIGSTTEYGVQYTGIENLEVGFAQGDNDDSLTNSIENTHLYATYTMDAFTFGIQDNEADGQTANGDTEFRAYGLSYAVTDELSVSYGMSQFEYENTTLEDQDANAISASYTNGSVTVSATHTKVENIAGTATNDRSGYEVNFKFAF